MSKEIHDKSINSLVRVLDKAVQARITAACIRTEAIAALHNAQKAVEKTQADCDAAYDVYSTARECLETALKEKT